MPTNNNNKTDKKHRNKKKKEKRKNIKSPLSGDVDTSLVDKVYHKTKVDENLRKSGHHTEGPIRGKKKSQYHASGKGKRMGTDFLT